MGATVNMALYNTAKGLPLRRRTAPATWRSPPIPAVAGCTRTSRSRRCWHVVPGHGVAVGAIGDGDRHAVPVGARRHQYQQLPSLQRDGGSYTEVQVAYDATSNVSTLRFQLYPTANGGTTDMDTASLEPNLLQSGSFESSDTGWNVMPAGEVDMLLRNTAQGAPGPAQDGDGYLQVNAIATGGSAYQDIPVAASAGTSYTGTAWLSAESGTATGTLCLWGLGATSTNNCRSYSVTAGSYTQIQVVYDTPENVSTLRFQLYPTRAAAPPISTQPASAD